MKEILWEQGVWLNPPANSVQENSHLKVTTIHESDFWRNTSYGFVHDSGHALLRDFPVELFDGSYFCSRLLRAI
jgi:uncharacterized protein